jgi:hypothetical protein
VSMKKQHESQSRAQQAAPSHPASGPSEHWPEESAAPAGCRSEGSSTIASSGHLDISNLEQAARATPAKEGRPPIPSLLPAATPAAARRRPPPRQQPQAAVPAAAAALLLLAI